MTEQSEGGVIEAVPKKKAVLPKVLSWEGTDPPTYTATSQWDEVVAEIRSKPGHEWAKVQKPSAWSSGTATWFRKKFTDLNMLVPPRPKGEKPTDYVFIRRAPLAQTPED